MADRVDADLSERESVMAAFTETAVACDYIHVVVIVPRVPDVTDLPLIATAESSWDHDCEPVLRSGFWCTQASFGHMSARGGRIVFVVPTISMTGLAGVVGFATATEGLRGLAKSAARAWGSHGITANVVAVPIKQFGVTVTPPQEVPSRWEPALGRLPLAHADAVALLSGDLAGFVTGQTVTVDGGVLMAP